MSDRIVKTEAVVLKRMDYLESSRIVTMFTRDQGKVAVIAKGARSKNNRFGSSLEPGVITHVVYYTKPNRELQTLTHAETVERFRQLSASMARLTGALHLLDLAHAVTTAGDHHPEFYDLLRGALRAVDRREEGLPAVLLGYRLKLARISGFAPQLDSCAQCGRPIGNIHADGLWIFDVQRGGVLCSSCGRSAADGRRAHADLAGGKVRVTPDRIDTLRNLLREDFPAYREGLVGPGVWNELDSILRLYERHHVLHGRTLKTESMVREFIA